MITYVMAYENKLELNKNKIVSVAFSFKETNLFYTKTYKISESYK